MKKMKRNEIRKKILGYFNECYEFEYEQVKESDLIEVISVILKKNVKAFRNDLANKIINDFEINDLNEDIETWKTLKDVINYVDSKVNKVDEKDEEIREYLRKRYLKKSNDEFVVMNWRTFEALKRRSDTYVKISPNQDEWRFLGEKVLIDNNAPDDKFILRKGEEIVSVEDARTYYKGTI